MGDLLIAVWREWRSASPVRRRAVTQEQYWVLKTLDEEGALRVKDLAARLGCTPGSASVAVKRMERDGLVERERSRKDERVVSVSLTRRGRSNLRWWRAEQLNSISSLFEVLTPGERANLKVLLQKGLESAGTASRAAGGKEKWQ